MCGSVAVLSPGGLRASPYSDSLVPLPPIVWVLFISSLLLFPRLSVLILNTLAWTFRHTLEHSLNFFRSGNLLSDNNVQQLKETMCQLWVIIKANLSGMDRLIANDTTDVCCLLNAYR